MALSEGLFCETLAVQDFLMKLAWSIETTRATEVRVIKEFRARYSVKLRGFSRTQRLSIAAVALHMKEHEDEMR